MIVLIATFRLDAQSPSPQFIHLYNTALEKALQKNDLGPVAAFHARNIRLMPPFQKTMKGVTAVGSYYQAISNRFIIAKLQFKSLRILPFDTLVVDQGTFELVVQPRGGTMQQTITGNYLHLWSTRNSNKPQLLTDAWNVKQLPFDNELFRFRELPTVDVALMPHVPVNDDVSFELAALNRMMEATVSQHDAIAWTLFYANDACFLASDGQYYSGKDAIRKYLVDHAAGMPVFEKLDIRNDQIDDLGNGYIIEYASHIANWRFDEHSGIGLGKDFRIWKRQANGTLKIVTHIGSYD